MSITHDLENGDRGGQEGEIKEPLINQQDKLSASKADGSPAPGDDGCGDKGSIWMVLLSTFVAVCGSFEFGSCVGYSAPTQSAIMGELGLSIAEFSIFGSLVTIGAMIGAVTSGRIADFIGRKGAMRVSAISCIVGWLAIYFAKGSFSLDIGRLCSGYGIGVVSYVVPVFIAEITPKNLRGGLTTVNQLMICTGVSVTYIIGTLITWRTLALAGLVPCVILLIGLFFIPESPRWLAKVGRQKEFEVALKRLRGKNADISHEIAEIQDYIITLESFPKAKLMDLFQRRYARSVIIGVGLMVFQQFGGINGIIFYASDIFVSAGFSSGKLGTIAMAVIQVPITALGAVLMDKSGRRPLLLMSATGTFFGCLLAGTSLYLKFTIPGGRHAMHHTSLLQKAGVARVPPKISLSSTSYLDMLNDSRSNRTFYGAIKKAVTKPCHVLDIGAGIGLLSMMASKAMESYGGKGMVSSCESYLPMVKLMRKVVRQNGMEKKIRIFHKRSDELKVGLDLPSRADVLISEILDSELLGEGLKPTLEHAHDELLAANPLTIPYRATTYGQVY